MTVDHNLWLRGILDAGQLAALATMVDDQGQPGSRIGHFTPEAAHVLRHLCNLVYAYSLPNARLVRCVWFSKGAEANWGVPWHQDRIIAVSVQANLDGFGNWSRKADQWHCEPPVQVFDRMRFVRVHLDACDALNGAMEIALGSHLEGAVPMAEAADRAGAYPNEICAAGPGDVQILPMLTLHRSRPGTSSAPRRAIRLDFAAGDLPAPLQWTDLLAFGGI